jgi:hypothetical protein
MLIRRIQSQIGQRPAVQLLQLPPAQDAQAPADEQFEQVATSAPTAGGASSGNTGREAIHGDIQ